MLSRISSVAVGLQLAQDGLQLSAQRPGENIRSERWDQQGDYEEKGYRCAKTMRRAAG